MRNSISPFDRWGNWDPEMLRKFPNITRLGSRITLVQIQADWFQNPCCKPLIDTTWFWKSSIPNTLPNTWHVGMEQLLKGLTVHTWAKVAYTMKRGELTCGRQWYYFIWLTSFEDNHEAATGACTDNFQAGKKRQTWSPLSWRKYSSVGDGNEQEVLIAKYESAKKEANKVMIENNRSERETFYVFGGQGRPPLKRKPLIWDLTSGGDHRRQNGYGSWSAKVLPFHFL